MKRIAKIVDISGTVTDEPDFPVAIVRDPREEPDGTVGEGLVVDPVFDWHITKNLFGRVMTLVEATCETHKLDAVKDLFAKELRSWETDVYESAREIATGGNSSRNLYTKDSIR